VLITHRATAFKATSFGFVQVSLNCCPRL